jgi:hypothetical protein
VSPEAPSTNAMRPTGISMNVIENVDDFEVVCAAADGGWALDSFRLSRRCLVERKQCYESSLRKCRPDP